MRLQVYRLAYSPEWRYVVVDGDRKPLETAVNPTWIEAIRNGLEALMRRCG